MPQLPLGKREIGVQTNLTFEHLSSYSDAELKDPNILQRKFTMESVLKDESSCKFYTGKYKVVLSIEICFCVTYIV